MYNETNENKVTFNNEVKPEKGKSEDGNNIINQSVDNVKNAVANSEESEDSSLGYYIILIIGVCLVLVIAIGSMFSDVFFWD